MAVVRPRHRPEVGPPLRDVKAMPTPVVQPPFGKTVDRRLGAPRERQRRQQGPATPRAAVWREARLAAAGSAVEISVPGLIRRAGSAATAPERGPVERLATARVA